MCVSLGICLDQRHPAVLRPDGLSQPWRCLWRGSLQMTMTRPCRRITRHFWQILLTLGLTFTVALLPIWPGYAFCATPDVEDGHGLPGRRQDYL